MNLAGLLGRWRWNILQFALHGDQPVSKVLFEDQRYENLHLVKSK